LNKFLLLIFVFINLLFTEFLLADIDIVLDDRTPQVEGKQVISLEFGLGTLQRLRADTVSKKSAIKHNLGFGGFKLGAEDIGLRLFLSYRSYDIEAVWVNDFGISFDSVIDIGSRFQFFYGLNGGVISYQIVDKNETSSYNKDFTPYYGLESGFIFKFDKHNEIELGGRFMITNINKTDNQSRIFDNLITYYIAYNFLF
jgi:hypothetical protein